MIARNPSDSAVAVTHSDSDGWLACDGDILSVWPQAVGYSLITAFRGWPNWDGPNVALLWEVFGDGCPGPGDSNELRAWSHIDGAVKRAQHVFLFPDVLDIEPLLIYRSICAPTQEFVESAVKRARDIRAADAERQQRRREVFGEPENLGNNAHLDDDRPFDHEVDS